MQSMPFSAVPTPACRSWCGEGVTLLKELSDMPVLDEFPPSARSTPLKIGQIVGGAVLALYIGCCATSPNCASSDNTCILRYILRE